METGRSLVFLVSGCFLIVSALESKLSASRFRGISPQDLRYFATAKIIACKDGSKSFSIDRLNDGFCDCGDGTDEPGTSACPEGKFYCKNAGSMPRLLFSSRVNDQICDCCDGSDEYDGSVSCQNTCSKDGNVYNEYNSMRTNLDDESTHEEKIRSSLEDLIQKIKDLKTAVIMEVVLVICLMSFGLFRWHIRSRRRRHR